MRVGAVIYYDLFIPGLSELLALLGVCSTCHTDECSVHETFRCRRCGDRVLWEYDMCPTCFPEDANVLTRWIFEDGFARMVP